MTVDELFHELELTLSDLCFSGLQNAPPTLLGKLGTQDGLRGWMDQLGMHDGTLLLDGLRQDLQSYKLGEISAKNVADRLCALEFYCRNVIENQRG